MHRIHTIAVAAAFAAAPLAFAHTDGGPYGTPKTYCEDVKGDRLYHDYGTSTAGLVLLPYDGSLQSCPYSAGTETPMFDGHFEYAFGGAVLVSGSDSAAAAACGWPYPDHPAFPTIWVWDHALSIIPADVAFSVFSDTLNNIPPVDPNEPNCGDFEGDFGVDCVNHCTIWFPPGLDQTYEVQVNGVVGHVWTSGTQPPPPPPPPCVWSDRSVFAYTLTGGDGWDTYVRAKVDFRYGCPGGPVVRDIGRVCISGESRWTVVACNPDDPQPGGGVAGYFQCADPSCQGLPAHRLGMRVHVYNDGWFTCVPSIPPEAIGHYQVACEEF